MGRNTDVITNQDIGVLEFQKELRILILNILDRAQLDAVLFRDNKDDYQMILPGTDYLRRDEVESFIRSDTCKAFCGALGFSYYDYLESIATRSYRNKRYTGRPHKKKGKTHDTVRN